jgi:N-formylglutamate deformylase
MKAFFISIPHSGEKLPPEADWLRGLPEPILMCDVDRYVDRLYKPAIEHAACPSVLAEWHRYVADLNRLPLDIDVDAVVGAPNPSGKFPQGLHWIRTTTGIPLLKKPMTMEKHAHIVENYFQPFHISVAEIYANFKAQGFKKVYHLDAHSMPSMGTSAHKDPGQKRAEIVVSDQEGKSCETKYKDLVIESYKKAGFQVAYNWPYVGGRVTQTYGKPDIGQHTIQVELNRALYMNEETKAFKPKEAAEITKRIDAAVANIVKEL